MGQEAKGDSSKLKGEAGAAQLVAGHREENATAVEGCIPCIKYYSTGARGGAASCSVAEISYVTTTPEWRDQQTKHDQDKDQYKRGKGARKEVRAVVCG